MIDTKNEMSVQHGRYHKKWGMLLALLVVIAVAVWISATPANFPAVNGTFWQAVFLDNNQVYFGHLSNYNEGYVVLKNIFYLRTAEPLQQNAQGPNLNLVKLGGELHGPQDEMYIPKGKIMFWENLKSDSQVSKTITDFLAPQKK